MDPAVPRRKLRTQLRIFREGVGLSQEEVIKAMDWSISKLKRIESSTSNIRTNDLLALLKLYGVEPALHAELVKLAQAARATPSWRIYRDVASPEYIEFLGYESSALTIRNFEPLLVPALLQTEEYSRAVLKASEYDDPEKVDALVDLCMQRQDVLVQRPAKRFHFILDEAVIRRVVGGREVTKGQLNRLKELALQPNITIRLMPFSLGMYPRLRVSYVLFELPDSADGNVYVLYLEDSFDGFIMRDNSMEARRRVTPAGYLKVFQRLARASSPDGFLKFVERALWDLG